MHVLLGILTAITATFVIPFAGEWMTATVRLVAAGLLGRVAADQLVAAVADCALARSATCSGVPEATIWPPPSPPSGPRSTI